MHNRRGFMLIELLIVVAVIAILAAIALPTYQSFVLQSKIRIAQSDLQAWSAVVENYRQRTLQFPADETTAKQGFQPASKPADFGFTYQADDGGYTLTADGAGGFDGCTLTLAADNVRSSSGCEKFGGAAW